MILFRGIWLKFSWVALAFQPSFKSAQKKLANTMPPKKIPPKKIRREKNALTIGAKYVIQTIGRYQRTLRDLG